MDLISKSSLSNVNLCCRTCMTGNSALLNIFENSIDCTSVAEILRSYTSLNITKNDTLPKGICQHCFDKLNSFCEFRILAEKVETKLRELLGGETNLSFGCDLKENKRLEEIKIENTFLQGDPTIGIKEESSEADISIEDTKNNVFVFLDNIKNKTEPIDSDFHLVKNSETNLKTSYNNSEKYKCEICNKTFRSHSNYQRHTKNHSNNNHTILDDMVNDKEHTGNKIIKCNICASEFKSLRSLSSHMKIHKDGKEMTWEINIELEKTNDSLQATTSPNAGDFQCKVCNGQFRTKHSLSAHMRKHAQKGRVLACGICSKIFNKVSHLKRHEYSHEDNCPFKCGMCKKSYPTEESLQEHTKQHNEIKPYVCPVCQKAFYHKVGLNTHIKIHTRDKLFLCPTCGKRFDSSTNLNQHVRRHTGIKAFSCLRCPKKFVSKGELKSHIITHTGEKLYKCEQCSASFTKNSTLVQHNLRHLGVKPHQCDTCPMKFTTRSHLKRHYRIHTGEKPYKCDMCERAFTQSNDLVKHRQRHLGDKLYKCNECTESFRLKMELRDHISQHYVSYIEQQNGETNAAKDINIVTELTEKNSNKEKQ